ncbi:MAG: hypothetical protein IJ325_03910 [Clostridia bacterium]|nr:hypothetical protein [Clostridia bacterium]
MKTKKVFWGIVLIAAAVLIIIDALGFLSPISGIMGEISLFRAALALLCLYFIVTRIAKGKIAQIFIPLSLIFMLFEKNIAFLVKWESENIISNFLLLFCALIVTIGWDMIFGNLKLKIKTGESVVYIDGSDFSSRRFAENLLGECNIYFENTDQYCGDGILIVDNCLGEMNIHVPSAWKIELDIENGFGDTSQTGSGTENGPRLRIVGKNRLGEILVKVINV